MTQQQARHSERTTESTTEQPAAPPKSKQQKRDLSGIDALLDEIEEVLEDNDDKRPDFDYKAKLKSWAKAQGNVRRNGDPCEDCVEQVADLLADGYVPAPPSWESVEGAIEVPCGCC